MNNNFTNYKIKSNIAIFPNPCSAYINIEFDFMIKQNVTIDIYNVFGQKCFTQNLYIPFDKFTYHFDLNNLPKGFYNVRINNGQQCQIKKIEII
jgi:hypothetical protein